MEEKCQLRAEGKAWRRMGCSHWTLKNRLMVCDEMQQHGTLWRIFQKPDLLFIYLRLSVLKMSGLIWRHYWKMLALIHVLQEALFLRWVLFLRRQDLRWVFLSSSEKSRRLSPNWISLVVQGISGVSGSRARSPTPISPTVALLLRLNWVSFEWQVELL